MIDILYNKLKSLHDGSIHDGSLSDISGTAEWKDVAPAIFNRHSQHSLEHSPKEIEKVQEVPASKNTKDTKVAKPSVKKTATTIKPLDMLCDIMNDTVSSATSATSATSANYIKESIITLITKDEFSKIFGMTKCAEIMSGIVNNRWNKSTALFISFFLDKEVYYNEKVIIYNKEKNKGRITI
jgi:hypothetical protein